MFIDSILLKNFRNINELKLKSSSKLNIFIGNNGQGKTNILEAIYFLLEKSSFRYGQNINYIQNNNEQSLLVAKLKSSDFEATVKLNLLPEKKIHLVNDKISSQFKDKIPTTILFSPDSLNIIKESADHRRKLIDSVVKSIYKNNDFIITDFLKILKMRNKILKDISESKISFNEGFKTLDSINEIFLKKSTDLTSIRIEVLRKLKNSVTEILNSIEQNKESVFNFIYTISDINSEKFNYEQIYQLMQKRMAELRQAEVKIGASLVGPQKHDVIFLYNGNDSRFYCSQGQQRSIILAFKMAQIVYHHKVNGNYPILLLDDVLSELDQTKQEALIKYLNTIEAQTFLTTTDLKSLSGLSIDEKYKFEIHDGNIKTYENESFTR